jgi:hypothetical protein
MTEVHGDPPDFDAIIAAAIRSWTCAVCGEPLPQSWRSFGPPPFCSVQHRTKFRDRRRYAEDPEGQRAKARAYYAANRERLLAKSKAEREQERALELRICSECGQPLEGRQRVLCGKRACKTARLRRLDPDGYAAREAAKVERRRVRRRELAEQHLAGEHGNEQGGVDERGSRMTPVPTPQTRSSGRAEGRSGPQEGRVTSG